MIDCGLNKIPEGHILKRWTRNARDYQYPDDVCTIAGEQLGQSLLFANALDVVKSTVKNPKAGEILTRHLNIARKEIEVLETTNEANNSLSDGNGTAGYVSASGTETGNGNLEDYDSGGIQVVTNKYGASGSSAYMSDADINRIKAPFVPKENGRKREKRFKPVFERKRKSRKRYTAKPMISEDSHEEGYLENLCIANDMEKSERVTKTGKKKRNKSK
jgi:hypothetical protein